ncbi:MAG: hypothetical protein ABIP90_09520 [Vicinamibacterales bacterium]
MQWAAIVAGLVCASLLGLDAQQAELDTSLPALLERLGKYVDQYERDLAAVVSEERYHQEVAALNGMFGDRRELRSDLLLSKAGDLGWVAFRDVFEVDGKEVRDRSDRLVNLFLKPTGESPDQVRKIVAESARLNVGWVSRNINVPTMVLQFAKSAEQYRSEFKRGGTGEAAGIKAREIRFQERKLPRMIGTRDGAAAQGRFWIEEATGRVVKTELRIVTGSTNATILVGYEFQPKLKLWLPILMNERYATPRQPVITGRAFYQNFRQFNVVVDQIIK